jgi:hypothetical protein
MPVPSDILLYGRVLVEELVCLELCALLACTYPAEVQGVQVEAVCGQEVVPGEQLRAHARRVWHARRILACLWHGLGHSG